MDIRKRFAAIITVCVLISFAHNAAAQDDAISHEEKSKAQQEQFKSDGDDFVDRMMKKIPYSESLKYTWDIVDGDTDLYFQDLRVDRGNMGVSYKMDALPVIGSLNGGELRADLGQDSKLTYKSNYVPLVGNVDGFQFTAATGTVDSRVSFRFKKSIAW